MDGKVSPDKLGVKALDDTTLQIKLDKATPYLLVLQGQVSFSHFKKTLKNGVNYFKPEHGSNSAFKIDQWVVNEKVVSVKHKLLEQ